MDSFAPFRITSDSQPSQLQLVGTLHEKDNLGNSMSIQKIYAHQKIIIGRDANRCHHVVQDAVVSNKHFCIYTIMFDDDQSDGIPPLVYAEDLSRNGTFWNGSLIGRGNGGVLLSDGDTLRVSARIHYRFLPAVKPNEDQVFDLTQEAEMKHFEKEYNVSERKLGSGAFGEVFMAIEQSRHTQRACKMVDLRKLRSSPRTRTGGLESAAAAEDVDSRAQMMNVKTWAEQKRKETRLEQQLKVHHREASILASLSHPNIIGIEKVYVTDNSIYIFQDLVTGGDLFSFLERKNGKLSDVEAAVIVRQILIALDYLHDQNIVHRDLKPENILMTSLASGCRVILTDFGHAKKIENDRTRMTTMAGTEQYIAPEILHVSRYFNAKRGYSKAVDMWSLGCVTVVLLTGGSPFVSKKTNQYCQKLAQECNLQQLDEDLEWQFVGRRTKDFVRGLLVLEEEQRMSVKEAKNHSWFSNDFHRVDFEEVYHRAIKHWRPRILKTPVIEMIHADQLNKLPLLRGSDVIRSRNSRRRSLVPVDPPYKPYPRRMGFSLVPRLGPRQPFAIFDEGRTAIREKWSPQQMRTPASGPEKDGVPALIADIESHGLGRPSDDPKTPEAPKQDARRALRPDSISPSKALVKIETNMGRETASKARAPTEMPIAPDSAHQALSRSSRHSSHGPSALCSARKYLIRPGNITSAPSAVNGNISQKTDRVAGDGDARIEEAVLSKDVDAMATEKPADTPVEDHEYQATDCVMIQGATTSNAQAESSVMVSSPPEDSNIPGIASDRSSVLAGLGEVNNTGLALKLRSCRSARLTTLSQRPSKPKKRRAPIYDLEEEEDADQGQQEGSRRADGSNRTNDKLGDVRKKSRTEQGRRDQETVHTESQLNLRSAGGFSAIGDGFMGFYFPR